MVAKISDILAGGRSISFEFFRRAPRRRKRSSRTLTELTLHPSYVSVTYGKGGTTGTARMTWWCTSTATRP